jgi:hypothetical protein
MSTTVTLLSAEPTALFARRGHVTIERTGDRYIITGSSGYHAELRVCLREECVTGQSAPCAIPLTTQHGRQHAIKLPNGKVSHGLDNWLKHTMQFCHNWHDERVLHFAGEVLKTYGGRK